MVYCTVCMNNNRKNKSISYFCYPRDSTKRELWLKAVGREDLLLKLSDEKTSEQYRICEEHFDKSVIKYSINRTKKYLYDDAFPTLKLTKNGKTSLSSSQCGLVSLRENILTTASSSIPFKEVKLEDVTSSGPQADPGACGSSSAQTALQPSADTPAKRKLEHREAKGHKRHDYASAPSVTTQPIAQSQSTQALVEDDVKRRKLSASSDDEEEDCAVFCKNLRIQMRHLDTEQNYICQKLISDAVFLARTGQLNLTSSIQTQPMIPVAPPPTTGYNRTPSAPSAGSSRGYHYVYTHSTSPCVQPPSPSRNDPGSANLADEHITIKLESDFETS